MKADTSEAVIPAMRRPGEQMFINSTPHNCDAALAVDFEVVNDGVEGVIDRQLLGAWNDRQVVVASAHTTAQQRISITLPFAVRTFSVTLPISGEIAEPPRLASLVERARSSRASHSEPRAPTSR